MNSAVESINNCLDLMHNYSAPFARPSQVDKLEDRVCLSLSEDTKRSIVLNNNATVSFPNSFSAENREKCQRTVSSHNTTRSKEIYKNCSILNFPKTDDFKSSATGNCVASENQEICLRTPTSNKMESKLMRGTSCILQSFPMKPDSFDFKSPSDAGNYTSTEKQEIASSDATTESKQKYGNCAVSNSYETSDFKSSDIGNSDVKVSKRNRFSKTWVELEKRQDVDEKLYTNEGGGFYNQELFSNDFWPHDNFRFPKKAKLFVCKICNDEFSTNNSLTRHYQHHAMKKSFKCKCCEQRFERQFDYLKHRLAHARGKEVSLLEDLKRKQGRLCNATEKDTSENEGETYNNKLDKVTLEGTSRKERRQDFTPVDCKLRRNTKQSNYLANCRSYYEREKKIEFDGNSLNISDEDDEMTDSADEGEHMIDSMDEGDQMMDSADVEDQMMDPADVEDQMMDSAEERDRMSESEVETDQWKDLTDEDEKMNSVDKEDRMDSEDEEDQRINSEDEDQMTDSADEGDQIKNSTDKGMSNSVGERNKKLDTTAEEDHITNYGIKDSKVDDSQVSDSNDEVDQNRDTTNRIESMPLAITFICQKCDMRFTSERAIYIHYRQHSSFQCAYCSEAYKYTKHLYRQMPTCLRMSPFLCNVEPQVQGLDYNHSAALVGLTEHSRKKRFELDVSMPFKIRPNPQLDGLICVLKAAVKEQKVLLRPKAAVKEQEVLFRPKAAVKEQKVLLRSKAAPTKQRRLQTKFNPKGPRINRSIHALKALQNRSKKSIKPQTKRSKLKRSSVINVPLEVPMQECHTNLPLINTDIINSHRLLSVSPTENGSQNMNVSGFRHSSRQRKSSMYYDERLYVKTAR